METIKPGIVVKDYYGNETTIYPTGIEWLFAFAIKGCDWAVKALEELNYINMRRLNMDENRTVQEVLAAVDEFLIYRTEGKLQELLQVRNKLRRERQQAEEKKQRKYAQTA